MVAAMRIAGAIALSCILLAGGLPGAWGQEDPAVLERRVKAAFLYKFTGYVTWPEGTFQRADNPITIGVIGDDLVAAETAQLVAGRSMDGRPLAVRRLAFGEPVQGVHILFVSRSETPRFAQILKALPAAPMLIVTESETAFRQGSAVNFLLLDGRVRFDVSLDAAERHGIRLSSRLLAVAKNVLGTPP